MKGLAAASTPLIANPTKPDAQVVVAPHKASMCDVRSALMSFAFSECAPCRGAAHIVCQSLNRLTFFRRPTGPHLAAFILPSVGRVASAPSPHCQTHANIRNHANHAQASHCGLRSGNLRTNRPSSCDRAVVGCALNSLDSCSRSASGVLELVLVETRPNGFDLGGNNALDQPRC